MTKTSDSWKLMDLNRMNQGNFRGDFIEKRCLFIRIQQTKWIKEIWATLYTNAK